MVDHTHSRHMKSIRIASGSGFWGDWLEAPRLQLESGEIDYLVLDYLAEVTMSVLAKQQQRDPNTGYAKDIVALVQELATTLEKKNVGLIANAGGMNPRGCAAAIADVLKSQGCSLKIAVVEGDDLMSDISQLKTAGETLSHFDTGADFSSVENSLLSANAYIGCSALVEALEAGANIIITGRVADAALALAPMVYRFGWQMNDWDKLAAGTIAGHILECGAQASGGNDSFDWESTKDLANIGYPIVEVFEDANFEVYKHETLGGKVSRETVIQQLIYEIGDPQNYIVPDVIADFTSLGLHETASNRVRVTGAKGKPRPEKLKVSCSYQSGYMSACTMLYSWPDAAKKAEIAAGIVEQRLKNSGITPQRLHSELVGLNACLGRHAPKPTADLPEVQLRIAAHDIERKVIQRFTRELAPLVLNGPPFATAYAGARGRISEVYAYWPTLVSRAHVAPSWEIING